MIVKKDLRRVIEMISNVYILLLWFTNDNLR